MHKVVLHTEVHPEDNAMLQALYSRSAESVTDHIEKLRKSGSGKFMSQYYLGYGHASIADCGFVTVYVEGVSMLCAKAIQDDELYNGQESSSRYIDWAEQHFINPFSLDSSLKGKSSGELLDSMRKFYVTQKPILIDHLKQQYPKKEDEKESVYEKAITAKAFDILRGYLPCGAATNVAWTTSLRKANERLSSLALHPLSEVREVARGLHKVMIEAYPNSIGPLPDFESADPYLKAIENYYESGFGADFEKYGVSNFMYNYSTIIEHHSFTPFSAIENNPALDPKLRPRKVRLAKHDVMSQTRMQINVNLDFGSYRDIQRHRANYCGMPIVTPVPGIHPWYYNQLPKVCQKAADELFVEITSFVKTNWGNPNLDLELQYFMPMGTLVPIMIDTNVRQAVYLAELRSGQTVHATLRPVAQAIGHYLEDVLSIPTTCDFTEDEWNIRRGTQDIVKKEV